MLFQNRETARTIRHAGEFHRQRTASPRKRWLIVALSTAVITASLLLNACVAVRENVPAMEEQPLPAGQAVIYIIAPRIWTDIDPSSLEIIAGESEPVRLQMRAVNRIIVPPGAWSLRLTKLPQSPDNARTRFIVNSGETLRLLLMRRAVENSAADSLSAKDIESKVEYLVLPIKRSVFNEVVREEDLPVVG